MATRLTKRTVTKKSGDANKNKNKSQNKATARKSVKKPTKKSSLKNQSATVKKSHNAKAKKKSATNKRSTRGKTDNRSPTKNKLSIAPIVPHACEAHVVVLQQQRNKFDLFEETLNQAGFWFSLEQARFYATTADRDFNIIIKPDLYACELTGSLATDPQLVEHLIDLLHDRGYKHVAVVDSRNSLDLCLENRDVQILADILGYQYITPKGREYDILDLGEALHDAQFDVKDLLRGTMLSDYWLNADFRILFGKNKTDEVNLYHLCAENFLSVLPLRDKEYHYRHRFNPADLLVELIRNTRVDFCIIDAYISNHGNGGSRCGRPLETHTFIAGNDLLLTDYAAAKKMGGNLRESPLYARAMREINLPQPYHIIGDLTVYQGWINVHPLLADSARRRERLVEISQLLHPWMQSVDQQLFPLKDPLNGQINKRVSKYLCGIDDNQTVFWSVVAFNYLIAWVYQVTENYQVMYWKDRLMQREVPLNIARNAYPLADYDSIATYLEPLEQRVLKLSADENGLRWCYHQDGSILFEFSRSLPVDYDAFINRVDITRSIQFMNDYIGGLIVPEKKDNKERTTHQIERNLYLPQPNYLALFQGEEIDVTKLEHIRYGNDQQKIYWKTILSENGSATYDDGSVEFRRMKNGETHISIFGRQQFTLPLFWQLVDLDRYPILKNFLVTHAYTVFFTNTMANFEAVNEGREVRIGRAWNPRAGEIDDELNQEPLSTRFIEVIKKVQSFAEESLPGKGETLLSQLFTAYKPASTHIDDDGFAHFQATDDNKSRRKEQDDNGLLEMIKGASSTTQGFWKGLYNAIQKDAGIQQG